MTVFIGGVHGAGKTYVGKPAGERLGLHYASASQLIREERGRASWGIEKVVSEVESNQKALIAATQRLHVSGKSLLLDGHFVLRIAPDRHEPIPIEVFGALRFFAIILVHCPIGILSARLLERGDSSWNQDELIRFSKAEFDHGSKVATTLRIPFVPLETPSPEQLESCLRRLLVDRAASQAERGL
ncbi:ATP-binding protein [Variovorax sp. ZT4R33]|uniref:ATP-binding protein n=1 Tax=Variovorax sp. ZT4R33 TaxID=3443743 RepID=UPI003F4454A7